MLENIPKVQSAEPGPTGFAQTYVSVGRGAATAKVRCGMWRLRVGCSQNADRDQVKSSCIAAVCLSHVYLATYTINVRQ